jgi:hypothetical protein
MIKALASAILVWVCWATPAMPLSKEPHGVIRKEPLGIFEFIELPRLWPTWDINSPHGCSPNLIDAPMFVKEWLLRR